MYEYGDCSVFVCDALEDSIRLVSIMHNTIYNGL